MKVLVVEDNIKLLKSIFLVKLKECFFNFNYFKLFIINADKRD